MKKLQPTTQYKKDLKRYKNNPQKLSDLKEVLKMLQNECTAECTAEPTLLCTRDRQRDITIVKKKLGL